MRDRMPFPPGQWRGPREIPYDFAPPRGYGGISHLVFPWVFLLLFAALVAVAVIALVRFSRWTREGPSRPARAAPEVRSVPDGALTDLRTRYARGEIDREEYLQKAADLGDTRPMPPPASA